VEQPIELPAWLGQHPAATVEYPAWGAADAVVFPGTAIPGTAGPAVLKVTLAEENSARLIILRAT